MGVHTEWWCTTLQVPYCFRTPCSCSAPTQCSMQQQLFVSPSHRGQDGVSYSCTHDGSHLNFRLDCLLCAKCASHFMALGIKSSGEHEVCPSRFRHKLSTANQSGDIDIADLVCSPSPSHGTYVGAYTSYQVQC